MTRTNRNIASVLRVFQFNWLFLMFILRKNGTNTKTHQYKHIIANIMNTTKVENITGAKTMSLLIALNLKVISLQTRKLTLS